MIVYDDDVVVAAAAAHRRGSVDGCTCSSCEEQLGRHANAVAAHLAAIRGDADPKRQIFHAVRSSMLKDCIRQ